jgi:hypothetical protein
MNVVWNGTEAESRHLLDAIARHCVCEYAADGACTRICPPHNALVHSQRFLDGLLFARRIANQLIAEEHLALETHSCPAGLKPSAG